MRVTFHNIRTAVYDPDLIGHTFMKPAELCFRARRYVFSTLVPSLNAVRKVQEVFKRAVIFLLVALGGVPAALFAVIGASLKITDLYRNFDEKVCRESEVSFSMPLSLEPFSRTGDRVAAYLRAKVAALTAELPLYYEPFKGSEIFAFDNLETNRGPRYYRKIEYLNTLEEIQNLKSLDKHQSTLYLVPFAPFHRDIEREGEGCSYTKYHPNWSLHKLTLQKLLQVKSEMMLLPEKTYLIAVHFRDGGDFDDDNTKTLCPLKLPPLNFYVGELNRVIAMKKKEGEERFFIHIFTDALDPEKLSQMVKDQVNVEGVEIDFSFTPKEKATLQYDVANMSRFDCMIRADSNLSGPVVKASPTIKWDIFPSGFTNKNGEIVISEITEVQGDRKTRQTTCYSRPERGYLPEFFKQFFYNHFGASRVPLEGSRFA